MRVQWTRSAASDLARLHDHLQPVAPEAAARIVQRLARAPDRLRDHPQIGERLDAYGPRDVRRIIVGDYELRYEVTPEAIIVLRIWHGRENRDLS